jgi:hypothetical protein
LFVYVATDQALTPLDHSYVDKFSLVFNQADQPYNVTADLLAYKNKELYQGTVPAGCYVFDFTEQGIANLGGAKNYIDTERMTQFDLKVNFKNISGNSNVIYVVAEKLAQLV